jgi:hypothetical protein
MAIATTAAAFPLPFIAILQITDASASLDAEQYGRDHHTPLAMRSQCSGCLASIWILAGSWC